ncbi:hypothetical protein QAD02_009082 [Eretmocerus hayati]|uniref:Uncharacterized protein n=1 Tax=Eretmocerus hayati TaxID=131215 RepID=A0ACC2N884_9HYME|nr:hypothetical protein QAD02_009082 [Eretmocerus hayati]
MIRFIAVILLGVEICHASQGITPSTLSRERRFVGGYHNSVAKHPSVVSIEYYDEHICSGTILDDSTILTTASCVVGKWPEKLKVVLNPLEGRTFEISKISHMVTKMAYHQSYSSIPLRRYYDVALLRLAHKIEFKNHVTPVELFSISNGIMRNENSTIFGRCIHSNRDILDKYLLRISVKIASHDECEPIFEKLKISMSARNHMCTLPLESAPCQLDNGGPLIMDDKQVGILIWHPDCQHLNGTLRESCGKIPSKYTNIDAVSEWIKETKLELSHPDAPVVPNYPAQPEDLVYNRNYEGESVDAKKASFIAAIVDKTGDLMCVGSIVGRAHVLTDTRCVNLPFDKLEVRVGPINGLYGEVKHQIVNRFSHPSFDIQNSSRTVNDIGLLQVEPSFNFTSFVNKIKLFGSRRAVVPGKTGVTYGWDGILDSLHSKQGLPIKGLQSQELIIRHRDECNWIYSNHSGIAIGQICASSWHGSCLGESGGGNPLTIDNDLAGIYIGNLKDCADNRFPGIYTEIGVYRDWISSILSEYERKYNSQETNGGVKKTKTTDSRAEPLILTCNSKNKNYQKCKGKTFDPNVDARPTALKEL